MRRFQKRFQNAAANVVKIDLIKGLLGDGFYVRSFCSRIKRGEEEEGGRGRGNSNHILLNSDEMRMEHTPRLVEIEHSVLPTSLSQSTFNKCSNGWNPGCSQCD